MQCAYFTVDCYCEVVFLVSILISHLKWASCDDNPMETVQIVVQGMVDCCELSKDQLQEQYFSIFMGAIYWLK